MIEEIKDTNEYVNDIQKDIDFMRNKMLETARVPKEYLTEQSNPWDIDKIANANSVAFDYCMHDVEFVCDLAKKTAKRQNIFRRIYDAILNFFNFRRQFKTYFLNRKHESK